MMTMGALYQVRPLFGFSLSKIASSYFQDHHEEDLFMYIAYSDESVYGGGMKALTGPAAKEECESESDV